MTFPAHYRTSTVLSLAEQIREGRWELAKFLADALEDAGADGAALAPLRDTGIADSRSGLWLAGIAGKDGLWEWGQAGEELKRIEPLDSFGTMTAVSALRSRRAELQRLHTGPCPTCGDRKTVPRGSLSKRDAPAASCPTCSGGLSNSPRERWDECRCPECVDERGRLTCRVCNGTADLLLDWHQERRDEMEARSRPLSFDLGPLPVVTVRLEEVVREVECPAKCRGGRYDPPCPTCAGLGRVPDPDSEYIDGTMDCPDCESEDCVTCSGTGVTHVPSEWLRALPPWIDVMLEEMEPRRNYFGRRGLFIPADEPRLQAIIGASVVEGDSPAAAVAALIAALRRWRYS